MGSDRRLQINVSNEGPELDEKGQMTAEEVEKRITKSTYVKEMISDIKGSPGDLIRIEYAFLTQKGYYPDGTCRKDTPRINFAERACIWKSHFVIILCIPS